MAAHVSASNVANATSTGENWSSTWDENYRSSNGWELKKTTDAGAAAAGITADGYYKVDGNGDILTGESNFVAEGDWNSYSETAWQSEWQTTYDEAYSSSYESAVASSNKAVEQTDRQGVITGKFNTTDTGSSTAAMEALASSLEASSAASATTNSGVTKTVDSTTGIATYSAAVNTDTRSSSQLESDYEQAYQAEFATAFSTASAAIERKSVSEVEVAGIGVIADVNAAASSNFTAKSNLIDGAERDGNGNGNASAGSSLATSSYANQSNSTTANAFMQAFSGGLPAPTGAETIKSITGSGTAAAPYSVVTDRTSTMRKTTTYQVDGTGTVQGTGTLVSDVEL